MASITIRRLDETTKQKLRVRAAHNRRSMEDEARTILRTVLTATLATPVDLGHAIHRRFARLGGIDLELPPRQAMGKAPKPGP